MTRPNAEDPLIPLPVRLPTSTVERLREQATAAGCTMSDVLRSHLTLSEAKPLGKPRPRRREPKKLGAVSGADPVLLRELSSIGNNMNQLARSVNSGLLCGTTISCVQILASLRAIEQQIMTIGERHAR
jgi:hypothetical protein